MSLPEKVSVTAVVDNYIDVFEPSTSLVERAMVGKLKKPLYFSENEQFGKSRHDSLLPTMSSLIINSHVKEGIDLGRQYKLNRKIMDIIKQHHGTSLVYYFYRRAKELKADEKIDENDFRYPGPKPQTKEAAIIMLADAVEAVFGAVYIDSGFDTCRQLILRLYEDKLHNIPDVQTLKDPKTSLQELLQSRHHPLPAYTVLEITGKAHNQMFKVECSIEDLDCITTAQGKSRRKAEQAAAKLAIEELNKKIAS